MKQNGLRIWSLLLVLALVLGIAPVAGAQTVTAKAVPKLKFEQKTYEVLDGFTLPLALKLPVGSDLPEDIEYTIPKSQRKYATIDKLSGVVTGILKGTVTVTAHSPSLGKKADGKCTVKVKANSKSWKMKKVGNNIYSKISPKRIYRHNGKTIAEYYLYNNVYYYGIKRFFVQSGTMAIVLYDTRGAGGGTFVAAGNLGAEYVFKSRIMAKKYGVMKVELTDVSPDLDFTSGNYALGFLSGETWIAGKDIGGIGIKSGER